MSNQSTVAFASCALLLVCLTATACASEDRQPGCTPPSDEAHLLEIFRDDPVFTVNPPAARRIDGPRSSTACRVLNREDASSTSVTLTFELTGAYTRDDLTAAYDHDIRGHGWVPISVDTSRPASPAEMHLSYCKVVREMPAYLAVDSVPGNAPDPRSSVSQTSASTQTAADHDARLVVSITAMPARPCPSAGT